MKENIVGPEPKEEQKRKGEYHKGDNTNWTSVYRAAFFLMFERFGGEFLLTEEYIMNEQPNRIDQIIIKRSSGSVDDVIAEFFRTVNVIEFKSPNDRYDVRACHRAIAYPMLLCEYGYSYPYRDKNVKMKVLPGDVTLTIVSEGRPDSVIAFLKEHCGKCSTPHAGIYRFENFGSIPVQLVVYSEMDDVKYMMLRSLTAKRLPDGAALSLSRSLADVDAGGTDDDRHRAELIMRFLWENHPEMFEEGESMFELAERIVAAKTRRLMEASRLEGEQRGEQRGEQKGMFNTLFELVRDGILSVKDAAARAMVSPDDFTSRMNAWAAANI